MSNFLNTLYFTKFENTNKEKKLRNIHYFDSDNACIRNDQSIHETMENGKIINKLIDEYIQQLKNGTV